MSLIFRTLSKPTLSRETLAKKNDPPVSRMLKPAAQAERSAPKKEERRQQTRAKVRVDARLRPAHAQDGDFKEILSTQNVSRGGLYLITTSRNYSPKMWLRVAYPYSCAHDLMTLEENAVVVRVETLADSRLGIALSLHGSSTHVSFGVTAGASGTARTERRLSKRHWFSATALVVEGKSKARLKARCSDLSLIGCYVDTLNPFSEGSVVQLYLSKDDAFFETLASAASSHTGMGMGLKFAELSLEQKAVLSDWLHKEANK